MGRLFTIAIAAGLGLGFGSYHFIDSRGGSPAPNRPPAQTPREQPRNTCCKVCT